MILFTYNNTELEYHPELSILEIRWIKILQEEQLKIIWQQISENITKFKIRFLLFDAPYLDYRQFLSEQRANAVLQKNTPATSLEKIAIVVSDMDKSNPDSQSSLLAWVKLSNFQHDFKIFHHHYEAMDWLLDSDEFKLSNNL